MPRVMRCPLGNFHSHCPAQTWMSLPAEAVGLVTLEKTSWRGIELNLPMGVTGTLEPGSSGGAQGKGKRPQT